MSQLPARPDLGHLRKQAKELLREFHDGDPVAAARLRAVLPDAKEPRLSDAQFCVARQYGFPSWPALRRHVEDTRGLTVSDWLRLVYGDETGGGTHAARPAQAARRLRSGVDGLDPLDPYLACAVGDLDGVSGAVAADRGWVHRPGGPLGMPPLVAVAHSSLVRLPEFADGVRACARALLAAGADPDQTLTPPGGHPLTALYGAAESLYHSLEGDLECTRLLLAAGATVTGTNAMYAVADHGATEVLGLLTSPAGSHRRAS